MIRLCFFISLFSHPAYSSECVDQFLNNIVNDVQRIQQDLKSSDTIRQLKALREMKSIKPNSASVSKWVLPFLNSEEAVLRLFAVQIIADSMNEHHQFIGALLLHLEHETSNLIAKFINGKINPSDRKTFYRGKDIVDRIEQLNTHFNKMNQFFAQLGIKHPKHLHNWIDKVLKKNAENRNAVEKDFIRFYQETRILTTNLREALSPTNTYEDFFELVGAYAKYTGRTVYFNDDVNMFIQYFYDNLRNTGPAP